MNPRTKRPWLRTALATLSVAALIAFALPSLPTVSSTAEAKGKKKKAPKPIREHFRRIATFNVFENTDIGTETVAEIVTATKDGKTLIYTDSETENIGFVDITDPANPVADGIVGVGGEPTSVGFAKGYALACINTSADFVNTSGDLKIIDVATRSVVRTIALGGQPDSIAISPNERYAAIAIENERDEDLGDGAPPQLPAGFVVVVDLKGKVADWTTKDIGLTGIADKFPEDPEPEFIDINRKNIAAVTLQENNHVVLIDLKKCTVVGDFSCGTVSLDCVDTLEEGLITLDSSILELPREPDAVTWIDTKRLATADEGDLDGGTRGFTIFNRNGTIEFEAGNSVEHQTVRIGHYPDERSENKGNEPEGIAFGTYGKNDLLFVGSERSSVILVYRLIGKSKTPVFHQVLPAGIAPEGLKPIPKRNLFVVASEDDDRGDKFRSSIAIYQWKKQTPTYPTIESADDASGKPIPFAALSALAADKDDDDCAYTVYDSFFGASRIFKVDASAKPAVITEQIVLDDLGATLDLDPEGLATREDGGFWLASEGVGTQGDAARPFQVPNRLYEVDTDGTVLGIVELPAATTDKQVRFGFEGVTSVGSGDDERVYVAFQREWAGDPDDKVRIGIYDPSNGDVDTAWTFVYYPLDLPTSPNGGWVGLSEIVHIEGTRFAILERDNQAGADARIKRIYEIDLAGVDGETEADGGFPTVTKSLVRDLMPDLEAPNGQVIEKVEGLTILGNGCVVIVTDNDGVDDASGETQFINLGKLFAGGDEDDDEGDDDDDEDDDDGDED